MQKRFACHCQHNFDMFIQSFLLLLVLVKDVSAVPSGELLGTFKRNLETENLIIDSTEYPLADYDCVDITNRVTCPDSKVFFVRFQNLHSITEPCNDFTQRLIITVDASEHAARNTAIYCIDNVGNDFVTSSQGISMRFRALGSTASRVDVSLTCISDPCISCYDQDKECSINPADFTSVTCTCPANNQNCDVIIDPCDSCQVYSTCDENSVCVCNTGFQENNGVCTRQITCEGQCGANTISHIDGRCEVGSNDLYQCVCNSGYFFQDGLGCKDIDECIQNPCHTDRICINEPGSYQCNCAVGFVDIGVTCLDINECLIGAYSCDVHATCQNTQGSYICRCDVGATLVDDVCEDIDECVAFVDVCGTASCENSDAVASNIRFRCFCPPGFVYAQKDCHDLNECAMGIDDCISHKNTRCDNTQGGFECNCLTGFVDVNGECKQNKCAGNQCGDGGECRNDFGVNECFCTTGFEADYNLPTNFCQDINECSAGACGSVQCENLNMLNDQKTHECICESGFAFNAGSLECTNINECADGSNECGANTVCVDEEGSYKCNCEDGFVEETQFTCGEAITTTLPECLTCVSVSTSVSVVASTTTTLFQAARGLIVMTVVEIRITVQTVFRQAARSIMYSNNMVQARFLFISLIPVLSFW